MPVSFDDLELAYEFASFNGLGEHHAYLCRQTGKIYYQSDHYEEELNDELPDDIENREKYILVPDKHELDLGKALVLDFVREFLPGDFDEVRYIFGKRGAYANFKALLARRRAIDRWHEYENEATKRALREWCKLNSIEVVG